MRQPTLLTYAYFCPADDRRPGGTQVFVGPLLRALSDRLGWRVRVCHPMSCDVRDHHEVPDPTPRDQHDAVVPHVAIDCADVFRSLAVEADVVLSIDRQLPAIVEPAVLMCNTLAYRTELTAVLSGRWDAVAVPTAQFAGRVRQLEPSLLVVPLGLGLEHDFLVRALDVPAVLGRPPGAVRVRFPHRPDPRKGHLDAVRALRSYPDFHLEMAWLREQRYRRFGRELTSTIASEGVGAQVSLHPWRDRDEHAREPSEHATVHVGDIEETFGLAVVESCLMGRPSVVHQQEATREVVGGNPFFVQTTDVSRWPESLIEFWEDPPSASFAFEARRELSARLSLDAVAGRYDALLREVAGAPDR